MASEPHDITTARSVAIDVIRHINPNTLDMGIWSCGSVACAGGWIARDERARAMGMGLADARVRGQSGPTFRGFCGYRAIAEFLGIGYSEATAVFAPGSWSHRNPHPGEVADRLEELLHAHP